MTRIISVSDEAYEMLAKHKGKDSFTKTIIRLCENKPKSLSEYAGVWSDEKNLDAVFKKIGNERRKKITRRDSTW